MIINSSFGKSPPLVNCLGCDVHGIASRSEHGLRNYPREPSHGSDYQACLYASHMALTER
jgi:hypothetical protein